MYCPTCNKRYEAGAFCASDGTALLIDPATGHLGQIVAERYRIERLLGEGGMGQVYEARHVNINKRFAIKLLKAEVVGSALSVQRFRQEAWAASSIGHENIVEIDDFATLPDGSVYLAMEFLDGVTVADRLRDGPPIALEEGVAVMHAVCRGLGAAHDKGIIHRDMKPENIFLARKSNRQVAKILDFGIAKMSGADEPSNLTRTGAIFGTPLYMSPEQARGKKADARSDVYSVGVILYELATGSVPFGGESPVEILNQHIAAAPILPTRLAPDRNIPPALEATILRALEKEPEARFQTMAELATELEAVAQALPPFSPVVSGPLNRSAGMTPLGTPPSLKLAPRASGDGVAARPSSSMRAHTPVATPAQRDAAGQMRISQPPPLSSSQPLAVAAGARATTDAPATEVDASTIPGATVGVAKPRSRMPLLVAAVAILGIGGGVIAWQLTRKSSATKTVAGDATKTVATPSATDSVASDATKTVATPPAPEEATREVILDSLPTGAKIVRAGRLVAETPEAMQIGARTELVLQKDGYLDKPVTLDGSEHKLVVKLERKAPPATTKLPKPPAPEKIAAEDPKKIASADPKKIASADPKKSASAEPKKRSDDPYEIIAAAPPPRAKVDKTPKDELQSRIEQAARQIPGTHRSGPFYAGTAARQNDHTDWFIQLDGGRCYAFIGEGGDGVNGLFLYLWGPAGRRVSDTRERTPHAQMTFCAPFGGLYHFQAKSAVGTGAYKVGVYQR